MTDDLGVPTRGKETYLGDGLYASFDGWQIILRAPRDGMDHWVALEPQVYQSLMRWIGRHPTLKLRLEQG